VVGFSTALYLALDALSVSAARVSRGLGGPSLVAFQRVPLAAGAVAVSASSRNLARPNEVADAVARALAGVGTASGPAVVVVPDGVARLALVTLAPDTDSRELVRFRLASSLPWDAAETIVDVLPAGRGRVVGAALRRATVLEHEQAAIAAGLTRDRVHLAPLLALERRLTSSAPDAVHVLLGDAAATFAAVQGGRIAALRSRRRDPSPGEAERLAAEAARIADSLERGSALPVAFAGSGATELRRAAGLAGASVLPGRAASDGEPAWLEGLLA
jgi:Tfp pilus assembly PilM family ATPase